MNAALNFLIGQQRRRVLRLPRCRDSAMAAAACAENLRLCLMGGRWFLRLLLPVSISAPVSFVPAGAMALSEQTAQALSLPRSDAPRTSLIPPETAPASAAAETALRPLPNRPPDLECSG